MLNTITQPQKSTSGTERAKSTSCSRAGEITLPAAMNKQGV
ncbi:Uncharacterised protein [Leclercia adecarboxylata]|uniref:Uncharacterized protein n=1 Tax=Leclercia adecarboxylata TaxID=83655 RepID=A0A4U9HSP1_9ENTR|nr:Uncharacterised protein [Leclercia adecarboxylata]